MKKKVINSEEIEWEDALGYPDGTKIKVLREEDEVKTFLIKLPKGFDMEEHSHIITEEHYVLEGQYEIEGKVYGPGTYRLIPGKFYSWSFYYKTRGYHIGYPGICEAGSTSSRIPDLIVNLKNNKESVICNSSENINIAIKREKDEWKLCMSQMRKENTSPSRGALSGRKVPKMRC